MTEQKPIEFTIPQPVQESRCRLQVDERRIEWHVSDSDGEFYPIHRDATPADIKAACKQNPELLQDVCGYVAGARLERDRAVLEITRLEKERDTARAIADLERPGRRKQTERAEKAERERDGAVAERNLSREGYSWINKQLNEQVKRAEKAEGECVRLRAALQARMGTRDPRPASPDTLRGAAGDIVNWFDSLVDENDSDAGTLEVSVGTLRRLKTALGKPECTCGTCRHFACWAGMKRYPDGSHPGGCRLRFNQYKPDDTNSHRTCDEWAAYSHEPEPPGLREAVARVQRNLSFHGAHAKGQSEIEQAVRRASGDLRAALAEPEPEGERSGGRGCTGCRYVDDNDSAACGGCVVFSHWTAAQPQPTPSPPEPEP